MCTDVSRRTELQHYIQRESDALALATDIASSLQDLKNMEPSASTEVCSQGLLRYALSVGGMWLRR